MTRESKNKIEAHPDWTYAGTYIDAEGYENLEKLISDLEKIDLVVVKSMRHLLGDVKVCFEQDNILIGKGGITWMT